MYNAQISGAELYSPIVEFTPKIKNDKLLWEFTCPSAGSVSLILQCILPCACPTENTTLIIEGGTTVDKSPSYYNLEHVLTPMLLKLGVNINCKLIKQGLFPVGKGKAQISIQSKQFTCHAFSMRGDIKQVRIHTLHGVRYTQYATNVTKLLSQEMKKLFPSVSQIIDTETYNHPKCNLRLFEVILETTNGYALSEEYYNQGKEDISQDIPVESILKVIKRYTENPLICVDRHICDQLIIYMCLASGKSMLTVGEVPLHLETMLSLVKQMKPTVAVSVDKSKDKEGITTISIDNK
jgi:RNA 3'-terminal phosphate cyclase (ATP)